MVEIFNLELDLKCPFCGEQLQGFNFENWSVSPLIVSYFGIECDRCKNKYVVNFNLIKLAQEEVE